MIGAIAGDIIGSRFEFDPIKTKDFELFTDECKFTDDTVLTIAVLDTIINGGAIAANFKKWGKKYPKSGWGQSFNNWLITDAKEPYNSYGNGAAMRISPVAYCIEDIKERHVRTVEYTAVTHNHPEGLRGALATVEAIILAKKERGFKTGYIKSELKRLFKYNLDRTVDMIRPGYKFNETCQKTVPEAIICFLESDSFEDAIRNAVSIGGDADTLACITGSIAEAYYGVPKEIANKAKSYLTDDIKEILDNYSYGLYQEES